jgi:hypothetical protein
MSHDWTLEKELCRLSGQHSVRTALETLGLIFPNENEAITDADARWERGGAETYIYRFWLSSTAGTRRGFIIKACVAMSAAHDINTTIKRWVKRRGVLASNGISVPELFYSGHGVILEEHIPMSLESQLQAHPDKFETIFPNIIHLIKSLKVKNFRPINLFSDLRTRGDDVVVVDFGEDLGDPDQDTSETFNLIDELVNILPKWSVKLNNKQTSQLSILKGLYIQ